jgi:hypothetical protein
MVIEQRFGNWRSSYCYSCCCLNNQSKSQNFVNWLWKKLNIRILSYFCNFVSEVGSLSLVLLSLLPSSNALASTMSNSKTYTE